MPRLLVVDDERSIRVTFRDTLSKHGYEVDVAADAEEALRLLAQQTYDTVLLDIVLPRMNGITLLQQLKERDPDVPVVMITGDPHLQTATEALRLGAYDYLQKPINRRTLVHVVQRAVDRRRLIAEKKALEAQLALRLKESEAAFRQLIEHSSDIILGLDLEGHVLVVNRSLETVLGHPRHTWHHVEVLLQHCHPEDTAALQQALAQAAGSHPAGDLEVRLRRADGAWLWFSLVLYPLIREDGAIFGIGGILRDVTMRKRMEQEMRHAERLALVGQLASGLAHEIGTPLNIIAGNAELLRMELGSEGTQATALRAIIEQADRITRLIERLLTLARSKEQPMQPLSLHEPLQHALRLLETRFSREAIRVHVDVPPDLPPVQGAADQLSQVFLNILVNAWHAMPEGGLLTIAARQTAEDRVRLSFRDTGVGMTPEQLAHAFEPFYSTKGDKGTGLGLAICQQIVSNHRGHIWLESTPGAGTTVTIELPVAV